jgi:hypothetical protein
VLKKIYAGIKELRQFLFTSASDFAKAHWDMSQEQQNKLAHRVKILKIAVFSLSLALAAAIIFFPPAAALTPAIKFVT